MDRIWQWSLPLFRFRGVDFRASWTLGLFMAFWIVDFLRAGGPPWLTPVIAAFVFLSVFLHELGHVFASRVMGGRCDGIVLHMLGGIGEYEGPRRPWPQFAISASGVLINGLIVGAAYLTRHLDGQHHFLPIWAGYLIGYLYSINLIVTVFNLIPCYPLDGGRMLFAAMWGLVGYRRGIFATLVISFPCAMAVLGFGIWRQDLLWSLFGIWLIMTAVREYQSWRMGSAVFGMDAYHYSAAAQQRELSWFARWRLRRSQHAQAERERRENEEQQHIDSLLAKVGESGLASLTKKERATLEAYSRKQRERLEA